MAKKVIETVVKVACGLTKIGIFGYAFGAGVTAVAGAFASTFVAGAETGMLVADKVKKDGTDTGTDSENSEPEDEETQDKVTFTEE